MIFNIILRKAKKTDKAILLRWRNNPLTIKNSLNAQVITPKQHNEWFTASLTSKNRILLIGEIIYSNKKKIRIGQVRFDKIESSLTVSKIKTYEISITVSPDVRAKGIGTQLLKAAETYARNNNFSNIIATIKKNNLASIRIFERTGYRRLNKNKKLKTGTVIYENSLLTKKIGLKIWSINYSSFQTLLKLYRNKIIDYVELYVVPCSFDEYRLKPLKNIPLIFHAPVSHNFNLSIKNKRFNEAVAELERFRDYFNEKRVIFHPGNLTGDEKNDFKKTILNLIRLKKKFTPILENVPRLGIDNKLIMLAAKPNEFKQILKETKVSFCLDFSHAFAASNYYKENPLNYIERLFALNPLMFHICDNIYTSRIDQHLHIGDGNLPLDKLLSLVPDTAMLCLETPKKDFKWLKEDIENLNKLKNILKLS
jgi:endonuclease IV